MARVSINVICSLCTLSPMYLAFPCTEITVIIGKFLSPLHKRSVFKLVVEDLAINIVDQLLHRGEMIATRTEMYTLAHDLAIVLARRHLSSTYS